MNCKDCNIVTYGPYCELCVRRRQLHHDHAEDYQAFLATLPRYEDEIGKIIQQVNRFDIPADKLTYFQQQVCQHLTIALLRKGTESHVYICGICGCDLWKF